MSLILIALLQLFLLFRNVISTCSTTSDVEFTFYGYPDGPSDTTSFGCSGTTQVTDGTAGGDGSYANPETFATALDNPNFVPCEIIYIPLFQKYFQYMDHCLECMNLYPGTTRIDLWIGSDVNGGQKQIDCEDAFGLKTGQTIVRDPPSTMQVNGGQLWDNDSGTCNDDSLVFPNYSTSESDLCGAGSTSTSDASSDNSPAVSSTSSPSATPAPSAVSTKEEVDTVDRVAAVKVNAAPIPSTTLATIVSAAPSTSTSVSSLPSPSDSSSDCGVTAEWPTAWLGHCVGTPCHEFNDCSGELICQGWPNPVCTVPTSGK
ncbi:hypothetical protein IMSHALPRED_000540 [Imshaugia aleurites]|uniref:Uncharacterized protein n=1 Tax=Imshaugia aleurites TaxID=172621 RepID=A0A8H3GAQ8_9LECA|nr:hypothetical protein IMSHALPRED_000540 [Imshaugia aleurites]